MKMYQAKTLEDIATLFDSMERQELVKRNSSITQKQRARYEAASLTWHAAAEILRNTELKVVFE